MKVTLTNLPGVLVLEPKVHDDARGFFFESYNEREFREAVNQDVHFVQDNHSRSVRGVLRGLHYQVPPRAQGKLVRVVAGKVFDVAVDIRRDSPFYGKWAGVELSDENNHQVWIPPGFAHGFLVLSDSADFLYKTTEYYAPRHEGAVRWDDNQIGIIWPMAPNEQPKVSRQDVVAPTLQDALPFREE